MSKIQKAAFGFGLPNSIGVYNGSARKWKEKVDSRVTSLMGIDFNLDGNFHMVTGYANGLVEVRNHLDGEIVHTKNMSSCVSEIMYEDYRMDGTS